MEFHRKAPGTGWGSPDGRRHSVCKSCFNADVRTKRAAKAHIPNRREILRSARKRALKKGIEFALTEDDIEIPVHCPVLGIPLSTSPPGQNKAWDNSPTLDRIDNSKGYVPDNVLIVSWKANRIKTDATLEDLRKIVGFYTRLVYPAEI